MFLFLIVMIVTEFILYGQRFKRQNKTSLYATVIFAIAGIMTQELSSGRFRIAYLSLAIGMTMLFIHTNEFAQLKTDESIQEQKIKKRATVATAARLLSY
jgi:EamA domain-containing membrane protein RarD